MTRSDNVLNMQITIASCMKQEWNMNFFFFIDLLDKYDILSYIDICYEEYNSMGIKGILNDLKTHISALERAV